MADELEETCIKLDELLHEFFVEWSKYRSLRNSLSSSMKDGFLCVSQSRYSMGIGCVSELQIPDNEFMPLFEVRPKKACSLLIEEKNNADEIQYDRQLLEILDFSAARSKGVELADVEKENLVLEQKKAEATPSEQKKKAESTVRRRNVPKTRPKKAAGKTASQKVIDNTKSGKEITSESTEKSKQNTSTKESDPETQRGDPLKWFGLLVPNSLKKGQKSFQCAINDIILVANSKKKLDGIISDFIKLTERKERLYSKNVETVSSKATE
eukprot:Seg2432.5 transcript_id=Seg2432.5/GoldUCD/mRNA.D3Y31 product="Coiled-coil domain-containing protein 115" protein_id=Seg2432.5/GoldUCD/D3Y31